ADRHAHLGVLRLHEHREVADAGEGRVERLASALLSVAKRFRRVWWELLAHDAIQILCARDDLTDLDLALAEAVQDRRCVIKRLGSAELLDGLIALASLGERHALDAERAGSGDVLGLAVLCPSGSRDA